MSYRRGSTEIKKIPLVSVIVPVYNCERYLGRCLDSLLGQTYKKMEIILVDDGSTDSSGDLCDEWAQKDSCIKVIHQENRGLSGARNTGILVARGEYIGFVDSDDWIDKEFYQRLMEVIFDTKCQMVSCDYVEVMENRKYHYKAKNFSVIKMNKEESMKWYLKKIIAGGKSDCPVWSKLYHRSVFTDIKFPEGMLFEDVVTNWLIINKIEGYAYCNRVGYFYFKRSDSISREPYKKESMDLVLGANMMQEITKNASSQIEILLRQYVAKAYFSVLIKMLKGNNVDKKDFVEILHKVKENYDCLRQSSLSVIRKVVLLGIKIVPDRMIVKLMEKQKRLV